MNFGEPVSLSACDLLKGAKARHAVYVYIDRHEIFLLQGSSQGADSGEKNKAVDEELTRAVLI